MLGFVESTARASAAATAARRESSQSDEEWWSANAPLLSRILDPARHPLAARVGSAAGAAHGATLDPDHAFRFGLERVLDGLDALVSSKGRKRPGPPRQAP
ncbi:TetR/AcrR family transcriptional regulator C-terminal domain-containing protein [Myxococcus stipitatus]|uniref:TetR/AcrR family transcriptional regulator C-terminal domain-containing protein n=1 Tax=Myxococcus stipitatus TaxID=83455 RepID=UPI001F2A589C|nr:TetR/AcrR family transcriptional regulator C-terminal domain-containing protein [Myxococcus stipitatus]MCE9673214.1 TetR/AcrR family transcriptional regulator C-terminal domain-containing protein [Myxococcus stipitatus]